MGAVLDKWRFQKLRHTTLTSKVVNVQIVPDRGEPRANIYKIPPISLSTSGFGPHLVIE
jgi:hypothetical protein